MVSLLIECCRCYPTMDVQLSIKREYNHKLCHFRIVQFVWQFYPNFRLIVTCSFS